MGLGNLVAVMGSGVFAVALVAPAQAQVREFNIPAGPLKAALDAYGRQAGRPILYKADEVRTARSPGYRGAASPERVLEAILADTGFAAHADGSGAVAIVRAGRTTSAATPQAGAEPGDAETPPTDDIVVVAQKRSERLIDVPVAVSSTSGQALARQNSVGLADYYSRIPGLSVSSSSTSGISLRGVTTGGNGTSPTVAVMIDDAPFGATSYLASPPFPDLDPAELERIEVLRGPQGTLYGASSTGGLIKLITRRPDPNRFSGRVEILGNKASGGDEGYAVRGSVNVPVIDDRVAVRASVGYREDPAYVDDIHPAVNRRNVNQSRTLTGRAALYAAATDRLTIDLSALYQRTRTTGTAAIELNPLPSAPLTDYRPRYGDNTINSLLDSAKSEFRMFQAKANYDLDSSEINVISAWSRSDRPVTQDVTSSFDFLLGLYPDSPTGSTVSLVGRDRTDKFSQEVRWSSKGTGTLEWIFGGFYTNERNAPEQGLIANDPSGGAIADVAVFLSPSSYKEWAVFGDLTYRLTDKFDVQVGGRWSENRQTFTQESLIDPAAQFLFGPSTTVSSKSKESVGTWLVSARYKFDRDLMAYVRVASGYRPGGPNPVALGVPRTYGSDSVISYELGAKGTVLDRRLTFDLALFQIDWDDIQILATQASGIGFNTNGGSARSRGLEASVQLTPWRGMTIAANSTWTDAELISAFAPPPAGGTSAVGRPGEDLPYAAKFSGNLFAEQRWPLAPGLEATASVNYSHVGSRRGQFASTAAPPALQSRLVLPAYDTVDLNLGVETAGWTVNLFVRNLTDERGLLNLANRNGTTPVVTATYIRPRIFGMSLAKAF
ncbi:TonB-dependent receptor [Sphingomonas cannabina]|uniref:TonB-dependent receptor domain-containing protein n=1 Tax=Sphingomonas cannabina TaxID=2899123 RepID=UPI001F15B2E4|nr:TonB-dependent receptor [Sphingomonas cannabina]UIJ43509.1 TonB-dependent receptor [Sphingomonas cannabina]